MAGQTRRQAGCGRWRLAAVIAAGLVGPLSWISPVNAQSATWLAAPTVINAGDGNLDFNANANWTPTTSPGSTTTTGTATFGASAGTNISFSSALTNVGGFTLTSAASNYTFFVGAASGSLNFNGAGIVVSGGSVSITNNVTGIVQFNGGSSAGSAAITNNDNALTLFLNSSTAGTARITNNNNGVTQFGQNAGVDTSTAGNATITNNSGGLLNFFAGTTAGNATIINNNGATTSFANTSTAGSAVITNAFEVIFNNASTAGNATINNNNTLAFHNTATAGGSTIVNNDFLQFFDGTSAGSSTLTNNHNTSFFTTSTAGSANITNNSVLGFFQTSTAGNATITNTSNLSFNNSATAGNATITNSSTGVTQFLDTSTGGNARLINNAAGGTFDFSGTHGPLGDGNVSAGSIEGGGIVNLGNNQVTIGSNNLSTTFSGVITGTPAIGNVPIIKVGTGTLTLTGNNTYTGPTLVLGGALEVDGSIASTALAGPGAMLSGTGTFGSGAGISTGGTLAPGNAANPTGTLAIVGDLSFQSNAFYLVHVGASASRTTVSVATQLGGTVQVAVGPGAQGMKTYDILHSTLGFLGGTTFSGVQSLTPGFAESLSYSTTDVFLTLTANLGGGIGGSTGNQQNAATIINNVFNSGGSLPPGFLNLFNLSGAQLSNALTQISGETATGSQQTTFDAMGMFMGLLTDPFMNRGGGFGGSSLSSGYADEALGYVSTGKKTDAFAMFTKAPPVQGAFEQRWSVWAAGFGGSQSTDGNAAAGTNNTTSNIAGTAVGADYLISPNTIAGFALAGGGTNFSVANAGTGRSDLFQAGAYVRHNQGPAYVSAALAYGWQDITTSRTVTVAGVDQLRAEFNANAWSGRLEGGYRYVAPAMFGIGITPYAAAQFVTFDLPAYAEQAISGSNTFAQAYGARDITDVRSELGIRTDKSWLVNEGILTFRTRLAWAHDYDPNRSVSATFQALPGASFVVNGAAQAADSALTTASVEMKWKSGWSAAATFEGEFSNVTSSYAGKGVVRYTW